MKKKTYSKKIIGAIAITIVLAAGISIHSIAAEDYRNFTSVNIKSYGTLTYDDGNTENNNGHEHDLFIDSADVVNLSNAVEELKSAFQDGVNKIYDKIAGLGFTPETKSPDSINEAIQDMYDSRYSKGCTDGAGRIQDNAKIEYTYHNHTGSPTSGGGCYTKSSLVTVYVRCDGQKKEGDPNFYRTVIISSLVDGRSEGTCTICGRTCGTNGGAAVGSSIICENAKEEYAYKYSPGCDMDTNTITGVAIEFTDIRKSYIAAEEYPVFTSVNIQSYGTFTYSDGNVNNNNGHEHDLHIYTVDVVNLSNAVEELQAAFRDGIKKIDNKLTGLGFTPETKSPDSINKAMQDMSDSRYREGYINRVSQLQSKAKITYIYHEHEGDSTNGGGCYKEISTESGTIYILDCGMSTDTIVGATIEFKK